jgi:hypothetical protein
VLVPLCTIDKSSSAALTRRAHTITNNLFSHRCTFHSAANFIVCSVALPCAHRRPGLLVCRKMLSTSPTKNKHSIIKTHFSKPFPLPRMPFVSFDFCAVTFLNQVFNKRSRLAFDPEQRKGFLYVYLFEKGISCRAMQIKPHSIMRPSPLLGDSACSHFRNATTIKIITIESLPCWLRVAFRIYNYTTTLLSSHNVPHLTLQCQGLPELTESGVMRKLRGIFNSIPSS